MPEPAWTKWEGSHRSPEHPPKTFKGYSEKFNNENGVVEITIGSDNRYNCSLTGISDKLKNEIDIYMHPLKRPYNFW